MKCGLLVRLQQSKPSCFDHHQGIRFLVLPRARTGLVIFVLLFGCTILRAQSTAQIEGQVTDQNGAVVVGAEVRAINRPIAVERKTVTDEAGRYQITALPVGDYRLEVAGKGFQIGRAHV